MATSNFFALLDDIATLLDDVALMSKTATKKTAGVLSDDLALNAHQVSGVKPDRELPVVWAVAKGSFVNKVILVPIALLISFFLPWLIAPLLMAGGAYLCFEGMEKVWGIFFHPEDEAKRKAERRQAMSTQELLALEQQKIKGAIRTDFILSAEIIVISLEVMKEFPLLKQCIALSVVAICITIAVYGLVALIVKIDDIGLHLSSLGKKWANYLGQALLWFAPQLMKGLSFFGTVAMFLVGGGIWFHAIDVLHHIDHGLADLIEINIAAGWLQSLSTSLASVLWQGIIGLIVGGIALLAVTLTEPFIHKFKTRP
ncbi:MAG: DUF808 domain-containing protein [Oleiphilus sp.]